MPPRTYTSSKEGFDRRTYEVTLTDTRESTGSTSLESAEGFVRMMGGEADDLRLSPVWPRELRVSLFQEQDLSVLTGAAEGDVRMEVATTAQGTRAKGFLFPDEFEDRPLGLQPDVVDLSGTDGIPLLGNLDFADVSYNVVDWPQITASRLLYILLSEVYSTDLMIEVGMNWYPETSTLTASDCPLANVTLDPTVYDGETALTALKDLLKPFDLILRQTFRNGQVRWHLRQPEVALGGIYDVWEITAGGTSVLATNLDVSRKLTTDEAEDHILEDHGRSPSRPRKRVVGTHNHGDVDYLVNGGFEEPGSAPDTLRRWTVGSPWTSGDGRAQHQNFSETPSQTANNIWFAQIEADTVETGVQWGFEQTIPIVPSSDALEIQWVGRQSPNFLTAIKCDINGNVLTTTTEEIRKGGPAGEVALPVTELVVGIPEGTTLPIYSEAPPRYEEQYFETTLQLTTRAERGDTVLRGELNDRVSTGWYVYYLRFVLAGNLSEEYFHPHIFVSPDRSEWQGASVRASMYTSTDTLVEGKTMDFRMGAVKESSTGSTEVWWFDDVSCVPLIGGSSAESMEASAEVGSHGEQDDFESILGSGPDVTSQERLQGFPSVVRTDSVNSFDTTNDNLYIDGDFRTSYPAGTEIYVAEAGIGSGFYKTDAVAYDNTDDETTISVDSAIHSIPSGTTAGANTEVSKVDTPAFDAFYWGIGPDPANTYPIHELRARRRLRQFRETNDRLELTFLYDDSTPIIQPHEWVEINGQGYTIASYDDAPLDGQIALTLLEHNDYGTA